VCESTTTLPSNRVEYYNAHTRTWACVIFFYLNRILLCTGMKKYQVAFLRETLIWFFGIEQKHIIQPYHRRVLRSIIHSEHNTCAVIQNELFNSARGIGKLLNLIWSVPVMACALTIERRTSISLFRNYKISGVSCCLIILTVLCVTKILRDIMRIKFLFHPSYM